MSAFNDIDVPCQECGEEFKGIVWTAIHSEADPELKEMLMGGELNILFCPKCSHTFFYEHFLLYQEPRLSLVAYVYPPSEESRREELTELMNRGFKDAQETFDEKVRLPYGPLLFFGLDKLIDHIRHQESALFEKEVSEAHTKTKLPPV